jgi:hypothetical protein
MAAFLRSFRGGKPDVRAGRKSGCNPKPLSACRQVEHEGGAADRRAAPEAISPGRGPGEGRRCSRAA